MCNITQQGAGSVNVRGGRGAWLKSAGLQVGPGVATLDGVQFGSMPLPSAAQGHPC